MHFKATIRAATSSYLGSLSAAATGLLSIKLATHFLTQEEFGLWSFTMQTVGYFMLMDLGVSNSVGRLLGEPLSSGDPKKINSWFTLSLMTLASQALIILSLGLLLRPYVLQWFNIPGHLLGRASNLWLAFLVIQAIALIFKLSFAILHAQNRIYWTSNLQVIGSWAGLAAFYFMLSNHWGVLAYAWSSGIAMLVVSFGGVLAVKRGGLKVRLSTEGITRSEVRRLFGFSGSIFVLGIASQVYFASQGLITTKLLGLEAAAILAVTSRTSGLAMQMIWKPFDAFNPRWQVSYCEGEIGRVQREFSFMSRFTILVAAAASSAVALLNQPFVLWWTKPDYFGGLSLSLLLCVFMLIQAINRCFVAPFTLTVRMKQYTSVSIASVGMAIVLMIFLTIKLGLIGIPLGLIAADILFPMWFYLKEGAKCFGVHGLSVLGTDLKFWLPITASACVVAVLLDRLEFQSSFLWLLTAAVITSFFCIPVLWRAFSLLKEIKKTPSSGTI